MQATVNEAARPRVFVLRIVVMLGAAALASVAMANPLRTVALTGQHAPGTPDGEIFADIGSAPLINDSGRVVFEAVLSGSGVTDQNRRGFWSEVSGSLALIAREGSSAPGTGAIFERLDGNTSVTVRGDHAAFIGSLNLRKLNTAPQRGVWIESLGYVQRVSQDTQPVAPSTEVPQTLFDVHIGPLPRLNRAGEVAFESVIRTGGDTDVAIVSGDLSGLRVVAREGEGAPGLGAFFGVPRDVALNDLGETVFTSLLSGGGINSLNDSVVWAERGNALRVVAREGGQAPGLPTGTVFETLSHSGLNLKPSINNAGQTAFRAYLRGAGVDASNNVSIWSEGAGALELVARTGDLAPTPVGRSRFTDAFRGAPMINREGTTAFNWEVAGEGVGSRYGMGIWFKKAHGPLELLALEGNPPAGAPADIHFDFLSLRSMNARGQIAFSTSTNTTDLPGYTGDMAIWATDSLGEIEMIVRLGQSLEVAPGDFRTVRALSIGGNVGGFGGGEDGRDSVINDRGQVTFGAYFTDGSSGIFVSNLVAVPEPSTALLLLLAVPVAALHQKLQPRNTNRR